MFAKNYIIDSKEFEPLSDIMDADYDTTKAYKIYVNEYSTSTRLCYTKRTDVPTTDNGRDIPPFTTIDVVANSGDDVYLKVTNGSVNVEISEA